MIGLDKERDHILARTNLNLENLVRKQQMPSGRKGDPTAFLFKYV